MAHPLPPRLRITAHIDIDIESQCWNWTGTKPDGYGRVCVNYKKMLAHRQSYLDFVGEIPTGTELDHLCRNKSCVNPAHLEPVTRIENIRRANESGAARGSKNKTHCKHGHPFTKENTRITPEGWRTCRECVRIKMRLTRAKYRNSQTMDQMT